MISIPGGEATLGQKRDNGFGWDNEFDEHTVYVKPFRISRYKITNGDYLDYVREGGTQPGFWTQEDGSWFLRCMFTHIPLPLNWPVYVTHEQASAYARWRGLRLPSEAEFHRAAFGTPTGEERQYPWGNDLEQNDGANFDFRYWDPIPVTASPETESAFGVRQLVGNGWEWTSSEFGPFPGFRPAPNYPGYSQNFFDGDHYVLKGASPRTAGCFLRRSFRNWFRPNYPYVYAAFRLVEDC
jgi:formylglycine-generating enzyme required for sulfatase activity